MHLQHAIWDSAGTIPTKLKTPLFFLTEVPFGTAFALFQGVPFFLAWWHHPAHLSSKIVEVLLL